MTFDAKPGDGWEQLYEAVEKRDVVFVLGAGVSTRSRNPMWPELVKRIAEDVDRPEIASLDPEAGLTYPTRLSILRRACERSGRSWSELMRDCLYKEWSAEEKALFGELNKAKRGSVDAARRIARENSTLASIVEFCAAPTSNPKMWAPNPRVAAVLTYNIDALVQLYDRCRHGSPRILRSIERASKKRQRDKIPLYYHLHGYLEPVAANPKKEASDALVFCEDEYHARTDHPFSFAMTIMLWALREFTVIFVGCSMTDGLVRIALHRAKSEHEQAARREQTRPREAPYFATFSHDTKRKLPDEVVEDHLGLVGVQPLWLDDFGQLPEQFRKLRARLDASATDSPA